VAVRELLINNPAVANVIRENKIPQIKRIVQTSAEEGMFSMQQNIKELLSQNIIDEVIALAYLNNI